jgi:hypothetical protein
MDERKGILTPDQEKILDDLIKLNSSVAESVDGVAITLIDNQGLQILKEKAEEKYPGISEEFIFPIVDGLFAGLSAIAKTETE